MRAKRSLAVIAIVLSVGLFAQAQNVSPEDREKAMKYLESTRQGVVDATKGLSEKQWNFKAAPDKWSIAEVTEHIAAAEDFLMVLVKEKVMTAPARTETEDVASVDAMVITAIPDRSHKAQAVSYTHLTLPTSD